LNPVGREYKLKNEREAIIENKQLRVREEETSLKRLSDNVRMRERSVQAQEASVEAQFRRSEFIWFL